MPQRRNLCTKKAGPFIPPTHLTVVECEAIPPSHTCGQGVNENPPAAPKRRSVNESRTLAFVVGVRAAHHSLSRPRTRVRPQQHPRLRSRAPEIAISIH